MVLQRLGGDGEGVDDGGEGGRVGEVHVVELVNRGAEGDGGDADVDYLVHGALAQDLDAQQLPGGLLSHEADAEVLHVGVELGLVIAGDGDVLGVVAGRAGGLDAQAGLAHVHAGQLQHVGAEDAAEGVGGGAGYRLAQRRAAMLAVEPMGVQLFLPVMKFFTMAQSPAA